MLSFWAKVHFNVAKIFDSSWLFFFFFFDFGKMEEKQRREKLSIA